MDLFSEESCMKRFLKPACKCIYKNVIHKQNINKFSYKEAICSFMAEFIIKRKFYFFFKDFMTGIKTRPAEISSVKMIGPSIRSVLVSMI